MSSSSVSSLVAVWTAATFLALLGLVAFPIEAGVSVGVEGRDESALLVEVLRRVPELGVLRSSSVSHCQIKGGSVNDFRKAF